MSSLPDALDKAVDQVLDKKISSGHDIDAIDAEILLLSNGLDWPGNPALLSRLSTLWKIRAMLENHKPSATFAPAAKSLPETIKITNMVPLPYKINQPRTIEKLKQLTSEDLILLTNLVDREHIRRGDVARLAVITAPGVNVPPISIPDEF